MASNEEWTVVAKPKQKKLQDKPPPIDPYVPRKPFQKRITHPMAKPNKPIGKDFSGDFNVRSLQNYKPDQTRNKENTYPKLANNNTDQMKYIQKDKSEIGTTKIPGIIVLPQKEKPKKTKKSKKKKPESHYLRSVNEMSLNLSDIFREVPKNIDASKTKISTGVTVRSQTHKKSKNTITPRNVLDSTAPLVRRGKERVTPKIKKPTKLKRLVLEERRLIKLQKDLRKQSSIDDTNKSIDFSTEKPIPEITVTFVDSDLIEHEAIECTDACDSSVSQNASIEEVKIQVKVEETDTVIPEDIDEKEEIESKPEIAKVEIETFQVSFIGEGLPGLHTKKFREYCYQMPDKEIDELSTKLLYELMKLQARQHDMNRIKSKGRKRLVFGFHEVTKHLRVQNLKCVVIARDLERSRAIGGLEHQITTICSLCRSQNVQVIFALTKRTLSFSVCKHKTIVSIVGILNYDGRQGIYKDLIALVVVKEQEYSDTVREKRNDLLDISIKSETSRDEHDKEAESDQNSNSSRKKMDKNSSNTLQLKKFEDKDVKIEEFVPKNFFPPECSYPDPYQSPYMHPYGYPPYQPVYQHYYYPAYQYSQYDQ
ncbi:Selenocysteine insertion sequence-binding protein 2 isoform X3 [Oopsacas minuta]|uniref:Selenocysteine insertion sequence-binding protein 2 isoform X3 n=1 Tax=Oopsacas minuta TaxID=111878 RepID=A0AAV7KCV3_9METZ|nr:Selenocysteine insertion sequence-binding protein 2 isoform X3 [Oopsacas minuta]